MSLIKIIQFNSFGDERGQLISLEGSKNIPFNIRRVYYIFATKMGVRRGFHAHKKLEQVLVCMSGQCSILLDNGKQKEIVRLDAPHVGLHIEGMVWRGMFDFSPGCVLMVLANAYYDETDYVRDYEQFLKESKT